MAYEQQKRSMREGVDIIIATPGRLIAHLSSGLLKMDQLQYLVLDEADRMLDMGFYEDIMKIVGYLPKQRQTVMFSATMPPKIRSLAATLLNEPESISLAISKPAEGINQQIYFVFDDQKVPLLTEILKSPIYKRIIVFAGRKEKVKELGKVFKKLGLKAVSWTY
jgi:superfamily II DNA/RNA helicase